MPARSESCWIGKDTVRLARRKLLQLAAAAGALPAVPRSVRAQHWPTRFVRLVVPFPAGGGADSVARILANRLSETWSQQVIVENKGGASGNPAYELVALAPPDGYTILLSPRPPAINRLLYSKLSYVPEVDFAPVTLIGKIAFLLAVPNSSPAKSLREFVSHAAANPGKISFASPGVGTGPHLAGELLKKMTGIDMAHVPYRGVAAGGLQDLMAGRIDAMFNAVTSLISPVRAGQVLGLAVTSAERLEIVPELPTISESAVPGFEASSWYGLFVTAKTPTEVVRKIYADCAAVLAEPATRAKFEPLGIIVLGSTPDELAATAQADVQRLGPIIKALNLAGG